MDCREVCRLIREQRPDLMSDVSEDEFILVGGILL